MINYFFKIYRLRSEIAEKVIKASKKEIIRKGGDWKRLKIRLAETLLSLNDYYVSALYLSVPTSDFVNKNFPFCRASD